MTPLGIEPLTFRLVEQRLSLCRSHPSTHTHTISRFQTVVATFLYVSCTRCWTKLLFCFLIGSFIILFFLSLSLCETWHFSSVSQNGLFGNPGFCIGSRIGFCIGLRIGFCLGFHIGFCKGFSVVPREENALWWKCMIGCPKSVQWIKLRMATFDTNRSVNYCTLTINRCFSPAAS
jgi:hypothetical protein